MDNFSLEKSVHELYRKLLIILLFYFLGIMPESRGNIILHMNIGKSE